MLNSVILIVVAVRARPDICGSRPVLTRTQCERKLEFCSCCWCWDAGPRALAWPDSCRPSRRHRRGRPGQIRVFHRPPMPQAYTGRLSATVLLSDSESMSNRRAQNQTRVIMIIMIIIMMRKKPRWTRMLAVQQKTAKGSTAAAHIFSKSKYRRLILSCSAIMLCKASVITVACSRPESAALGKGD